MSQGCSGEVATALAVSEESSLWQGGQADCEQLLRRESHSSRPCLWISSSGEVPDGKLALPCSLGGFLKAQGQSGLQQLRSRAKEVTSLSDTRISSAFGVKLCSIQAHRWCHRCCSSMEVELHLCLVPLEHCKCSVTSRSGLDNLKEQHLLISRC